MYFGENPVKMQHDVALHQGMHCLLRQNQFLEKKCIFSEIITCGPCINTINHPVLLYHIR